MTAAQRTLLDWLTDIRDASTAVIRQTAIVSMDEFAADELNRAFVVKQIENIGEAARYIGLLHPAFYAVTDFPWREMRATRNRLAHGYFEIRWPVVWKTAQQSMPGLLERVQAILDSAER